MELQQGPDRGRTGRCWAPGARRRAAGARDPRRHRGGARVLTPLFDRRRGSTGARPTGPGTRCASPASRPSWTSSRALGWLRPAPLPRQPARQGRGAPRLAHAGLRRGPRAGRGGAGRQRRGPRPARPRHARQPRVSRDVPPPRDRGGGRHAGGRAAARRRRGPRAGRRHPPRLPRPRRGLLLPQRPGLRDPGAEGRRARPAWPTWTSTPTTPTGSRRPSADDPSVLLVSTHEEDRWPRTGALEDEGAGNVFNLPLPRGCHDDDMARALDRLIGPAVAAHRPTRSSCRRARTASLEDPQARLALSNNAHARVLRGAAPAGAAADAAGRRGLQPVGVGRCWTRLWGVLAGHEAPDRLPPAARGVLRALDWRRPGTGAPRDAARGLGDDAGRPVARRGARPRARRRGSTGWRRAPQAPDPPRHPPAQRLRQDQRPGGDRDRHRRQAQRRGLAARHLQDRPDGEGSVRVSPGIEATKVIVAPNSPIALAKPSVAPAEHAGQRERQAHAQEGAQRPGAEVGRLLPEPAAPPRARGGWGARAAGRPSRAGGQRRAGPAEGEDEAAAGLQRRPRPAPARRRS